MTVAGDAQGKPQLAETEFPEVSLLGSSLLLKGTGTLTVCDLLTDELFDRI